MVSSGRSVAYITDSRDTAHPSHGIPYLIKDRNSFKQACAWFRWAMLALPYQQQQRKADVTVTSYDFRSRLDSHGLVKFHVPNETTSMLGALPGSEGPGRLCTRRPATTHSQTLRKARDRLESRDELVQDVMTVMARPKSTRDTTHHDALPDSKGHGRAATATSNLFQRRTMFNHVGGRCDIPTPKQSPVSRSCTATEEMPS